MRTGYWTIQRLEALGFKLLTDHKLWCRFKGHDCSVSINLDVNVVDGNHFNFHGNHFGWISLTIHDENEMMIFLEQWVYRKKGNRHRVNPFVKIREEQMNRARERLRNVDPDMFPDNLFTNEEE